MLTTIFLIIFCVLFFYKNIATISFNFLFETMLATFETMLATLETMLATFETMLATFETMLATF